VTNFIQQWFLRLNSRPFVGSAALPLEGWGSGRIPTLNGFRALAILAVIFHHATIPLVGAHPLLRFTERGSMGVDVFFALSGFLICTLLIKEINKSGRIDLKGFYLRRLFRILPAYYAYLGFVFVLTCFGICRIQLAEWIACLTFTKNYLPSHFWAWQTGHFWSLSVEEHFYLIFPAMLALVGIPRMRRWLPAFLILAAAWRMLDYRLHLFDRLIAGVPFPFRSDMRLDGIAFGCLTALLVANPRIRGAMQKRVSSVVIIAMLLSLHTLIVTKLPMSILLERALIPVIIAATALRPELWAARWLEWSFFQWVARLSYSLYLWQQLFFTPTVSSNVLWFHSSFARRLMLQQNIDGIWAFQLPFLMAGTFLMAMFSYHFIEQPSLRLGRRWMASRTLRHSVTPQSTACNFPVRSYQPFTDTPRPLVLRELSDSHYKESLS
jgi:peptidoglycan/LPS O-acetylase OafA/YrhL